MDTIQIRPAHIYNLDNGHYDENDFLPRIITDEFLQFNGAERCGHNGWIFKTNFDVLYDAVILEKNPNGDYSLIVETKVNSEDEPDEVWTLPNVRHIHELQHTLRVCGLSEFANSLKVEIIDEDW